MKSLTAKQWLVLTMLGMFNEPPTLKQLAKMYSTYQQNTLKLEPKAFLKITKAPEDAYTLHISTTDKCIEWELSNYQNHSSFVNQIFSI